MTPTFTLFQVEACESPTLSSTLTLGSTSPQQLIRLVLACHPTVSRKDSFRRVQLVRALCLTSCQNTQRQTMTASRPILLAH